MKCVFLCSPSPHSLIKYFHQSKINFIISLCHTVISSIFNAVFAKVAQCVWMASATVLHTPGFQYDARASTSTSKRTSASARIKKF